MISLCISFPSHCGSTLHTAGVFPVFCLISMPKIFVLVNIHQSSTTASKIEIIQKKITNRSISCRKFIPDVMPCFPADMIVNTYKTIISSLLSSPVKYEVEDSSEKISLSEPDIQYAIEKELFKSEWFEKQIFQE